MMPLRTVSRLAANLSAVWQGGGTRGGAQRRRQSGQCMGGPAGRQVGWGRLEEPERRGCAQSCGGQRQRPVGRQRRWQRQRSGGGARGTDKTISSQRQAQGALISRTRGSSKQNMHSPASSLSPTTAAARSSCCISSSSRRAALQARTGEAVA